MWEKKVDDVGACASGAADYSNPHCVNNIYYWTDPTTFAAPYPPSGSLFTDFLANLNGAIAESYPSNQFAGYHDWRIPRLDELVGILTAMYPNCTSSPCIPAIFGPTKAYEYWTSTSYTIRSDFAWYVDFLLGYPFTMQKNDHFHARAVRGGR